MHRELRRRRGRRRGAVAGRAALAEDVPGDGDGWLLIDDLVDTGRTALAVRERLPKAHFATLYAKPLGRPVVDTFVKEFRQEKWIYFPWDIDYRFVSPIRQRAGRREAPVSPSPRLELRHVTKRYGEVVANDDVALAVAPGEIHAVLGENGAGKTTLMKIVYGAVAPDAGDDLWNGAPVDIRSPHDARALGIAMVFQHFSLFDTLTVAENIWLGLARGDAARGRGADPPKVVRVRARRSTRPAGARHSRSASGSAWRSSGRCSPTRGC